VAYSWKENGRLPNSAHESRPLRIHEIVPDFTLEDVWALPAQGGPDDFPALLEIGAAFDPATSESRATRALWQLRDRLGSWFGLGRIRIAGEGSKPSLGELSIPGTGEMSLAGRLPDDLRDTSAGMDFDSLPFAFLYRTDTEFAAELSNQTVHAVMHLAWLEQSEGTYQGQMAVYVKPRGAFGKAYMALIKPFRYVIVYPALMRQFERAWDRRVPR